MHVPPYASKYAWCWISSHRCALDQLSGSRTACSFVKSSLCMRCHSALPKASGSRFVLASSVSHGMTRLHLGLVAFWRHPNGSSGRSVKASRLSGPVILFDAAPSHPGLLPPLLPSLTVLPCKLYPTDVVATHQ